MNDHPLSTSGNLRRQQILALAKMEARRRRRRRSMGRGGVIVMTLAILGFAILLPRKQAGLPIADSGRVAANSPALSQPAAVIEYVQTDPTITDRLSIKPEPPRWTNVGDAELLQELADAGQPAGIVCMNGKTMLLPR